MSFSTVAAIGLMIFFSIIPFVNIICAVKKGNYDHKIIGLLAFVANLAICFIIFLLIIYNPNPNNEIKSGLITLFIANIIPNVYSVLNMIKILTSDIYDKRWW